MKRKVFLILILFVIIYVYKINSQSVIIPDSSIRLRVIPNSNDSKDIFIKEQVKKYLEKDIYTLTKDTQNIEEARSIITDNIPLVESNIKNIFNENTYQQPFDVNFGYNYFPEKTYKGIKYKEGYYESLVISIGNADGDNWWCVLFPNFCLIDKSKTEYKSYIKEIIQKYSK